MKGKVLYGVKRAVATPIDRVTLQAKESGAIIFKTAEEVGIEKIVSEGSEEIKRTDDEILAIATTPDLAYGYDLTLVDNVFQLDFLALLEGGTVTYDTSDPKKIIGYSDPLMAQGDLSSSFQLDLYIPSYEGTTITGYTKLTFPNCTGKAEKLEFKKEFVSPEFTIKAREATVLGKSARQIDFVAVEDLPEVTE